MMSNETDLAWLAGIVDGEGSFSFGFSCSPSGRLHVRNRVCFAPQLGIAMIDDDAWLKKIEEVYKRHGIKYAIYRESRLNYRGKCLTHINVQRWSNILAISELLLPYLTIKRKHAEEFIAFGPERPRLLGRRWVDDHFERTVNWEGANRLLDLVDNIRAMNGKKQNVVHTREEIIERLKAMEGEQFPSVFATDNPRKRAEVGDR